MPLSPAEYEQIRTMLDFSGRKSLSLEEALTLLLPWVGHGCEGGAVVYEMVQCDHEEEETD